MNEIPLVIRSQEEMLELVIEQARRTCGGAPTAASTLGEICTSMAVVVPLLLRIEEATDDLIEFPPEVPYHPDVTLGALANFAYTLQPLK